MRATVRTPRPQTIPYQERWNERLNALDSRVARLKAVIDFRKAAQDAESAAETARTAAAAANSAASDLARVRLAADYRLYAGEQEKIAVLFTVSALVLAGAVGVYAIFFDDSTNSDSNTPQAIQNIARLAIGLGIAGYLAKQGSKHRAVATWAQTLTVQLATFGDYLAEVEEPTVRDELRLRFASKAFMSSPDTAVDSSSDLTWAQQAIAGVVEKRS